MRISSIDIGTNTILLLIADADNGGITSIVHDEQVIARLGKGVDEHKIISQETFHRAAGFLKSYRATIIRFQSEKTIAVGTSALRDAVNKSEFCRFIRSHTGIDIEILSGDDEAQWTYRGAIGTVSNPDKTFTVLDIGGGSTEIISGTAKKISGKVSLDIGCVRITERFLKSSPPTLAETAEARSFIHNQLTVVNLESANRSRVIGVAGTVTTLAAIDLNLLEYDSKKIEGYKIRYNEIRTVFEFLRGKTPEEIRAVPQIAAGRADIIFAGVIILLEFMERAKLTEITVSDRGLRYGIVFREIERNRSAY